MLQLPGILFFPEQSWQPLNTGQIQLAANMAQDLVITLSLFLIKGIDFSAYFHFVHNFKKWGFLIFMSEN